MKFYKNFNKTRGRAIQACPILGEATLIETRVEKALAGQGDIDMIRQPYYMPREGGVPDEINIRSDKMEVLRAAIGASQQKYFEDRENRNKSTTEEEPITPEEPKGAEAE